MLGIRKRLRIYPNKQILATFWGMSYEVMTPWKVKWPLKELKFGHFGWDIFGLENRSPSGFSPQRRRMPWNQRALEKNGPLVSKKLTLKKVMDTNGWLNKDTLGIVCKENIWRNDPIWRASFFNSVAQPPTSKESKRRMMDGRCKWCEWNILSDLSFAFQDFGWLIHKLHNFLDLQKAPIDSTSQVLLRHA